LRWTCKSRAKLTGALVAQGWRVSSSTVGRLLHALGYSLQALQKRREGTSHPDRNAQFEHINATAADFLAAGQPVISVDTNYDPSLIMGTALAVASRQRRANGLDAARSMPDLYT
jgi:hypothetical protein